MIKSSKTFVLTAIFIIILAPQFSFGDKTKNMDEFIFSIRPEFLTVIGEINTLGGVAEFGGVFPNGLYLTYDVSGGANYAGVGFNVGACFNQYGSVKNVLGAAVNFHYTNLVVDVIYEGNVEDLPEDETKRGKSISFGSVFYKIMFGKAAGNFDVTSRILFDYKKDSVSYDAGIGEINLKNGFGMKYVLGLGYTFMKGRK